MALALPFSLTKEVLAQMNPARFRRRGFFQNVLVVMTSTGLAQLITICFSPVLSRVYEPGDFGIYGTFLSVAGMLSAIVTMQYSEALMLPDKDEKAAGLFWAAGFSTLVITVLASLLWIFFPSWWKTLFKIQSLDGWLWLVPLAALVTGINETLTAWCARRKAFRRAATVQVGRSVTANSGQTAAGVAGWGPGGLIGGGLFGDVLASIGLFFWVVREDGAVLRAGADRKNILAVARQHKDFALYSTPQNLLNATSQGAPVILLIYYFGAAIGGIYAFAIRVLQLPMNFVLTSLRQVLFQKLSEVHNTGGDLKGLFAKTTFTLLGMSLVPAVIGFVLAPWVFGLVFGDKWGMAGEYARWLLIWLVPGFCNLPAALVGRILRQQRNLLLFDLGLLVSRIAVLVLGGMFGTALQTIVMFSLVGAVFNSFLIFFIWRLLNTENPAQPQGIPMTGIGMP
ncbi:MAG TPA: lipopolysaccharide biosynthesis protein [Candidatus Paceibacterota bacterium]|nr:lipopolysaccharide biosynthesis protein [Candidatus Paceibacterota bacterium]